MKRLIIGIIVLAVLLATGCDQAGIGNKQQTINVSQQQVLMVPGTDEVLEVLDETGTRYVPVTQASASLLATRQVIAVDGRYTYIGQEASR
jgi:hypothetical protein